MPPPAISGLDWLSAAKHRRSVYGLQATSAVPDSRVRDMIASVQSFAPSAYNTQPVRITLVTGDKHRQLWDTALAEMEPILRAAPNGDEVWGKLSGFFGMHRGAYGSILFWEDVAVLDKARETHASNAHLMESWAEHASGMSQLLVWTALELEGVGANLQHLNAFPPVEDALRRLVGVPDTYRLRANLNYGDLAQPHPESAPTKLPLDETFKHVS